MEKPNPAKIQTRNHQHHYGREEKRKDNECKRRELNHVRASIYNKGKLKATLGNKYHLNCSNIKATIEDAKQRLQGLILYKRSVIPTENTQN